MTATKRNWKIDLLRFIFAIGILVYHFSNQLPAIGGGIRLGLYANIGVQFFFVVSGYLLAQKILTSKEEIGVFEIAKRKLFSFFWIWVIAIVLTVILRIALGAREGYQAFFGDLFLLYSFGMTDVNMEFGWYLSSMMILTVLLTPVLNKLKKRERLKQDFVYLLLFELFVVGHLYTNLKITALEDIMGILMKGNVRACAGMLLGVLLFIYRHYIKTPCEKPKAVFFKIWGMILQIAAYLYLIIYMNNTESKKGIGEFLALSCMGIIVYYAFEAYGNNDKSTGKAAAVLSGFCNCLGKLSLPVYLLHTVVKNTIVVVFQGMNPFKQLVLIIVFTVILSAAVLVLRYIFDHIISRIKKTEPPKSGKTFCAYYTATAILAAVLCPIPIAVVDANVKDTFAVVDNAMVYANKSSVVRCYTGTVLSEDLYIEDSALLSDISFYTITWNKKFEDDQQIKFIVRNKETGEEVFTTTRKMSGFADAKIYTLIPDEMVELTGDTWYTIEFIPTTSEKQEVMALMMTKVTKTPKGKAYINGQATDEHISMKILTQEQ